MPTFGEKLRRERESRDTTIEEMSSTTGIGLSYLEALEQDEFDELPGRAFGKLYIRAYAKVLGFDPGPLLTEYDREQQRQRADEPPGGRPPKPIMARPAMPAESRRDDSPESGERVAEEASIEEMPVEISSESPGEGPIEVAIEADPADALEEPPAPVPEPSEGTDRPVDEPAEPNAEERTLTQSVESEPKAPREPRKAAPTRTARPAAAEPAPSVRRETSRSAGSIPDRRRIILVAALLAVPLLIVVVWALAALRGPATVTDDAPEISKPPVSSVLPGESSETAATGLPHEVAERPSEPEVEKRRPVAVETESPPSTHDAGTAAGDLVIDEFGVGRKVINHRLEGRGDRFREGEVIWFLTRVRGGRPGDRIRHVWLHEGTAVQTIDLTIGGPHWRTQSNKTLWGVGSWTVEARDGKGRVLARASFTCEPR